MSEDGQDTTPEFKLAVFKCNKCANNRPHLVLDNYEYDNNPLYLVVCQNCENGRIVQVNDQIGREMGKIVRCQCGKYKLENQFCEICRKLDERGKH